MSEDIDHHRRRFFGTAAMTVAAVQFGMASSADAQSSTQNRQIYPRSSRGRTRRSPR